MPKPEHDVQIRIDSREREIIEYCQKAWPNGSEIVDWTHQLRYGDIQIMVDGRTDLIIERKAAGDFRSSVADRDQRFRKQRANLILARRKYPGVYIMYLLEGDVRELYYEPGTKFTVDFLLDRQEDLVDKYGIATRFTADVQGTVKYIVKLYTRAKKHGSIEAINANVREDETDAMGQEKFRGDVEERADRAENPRKFLQHTLVGIYGMTVEKALCIVNKYSTLENLMHCYRRLTPFRRRTLEQSRCLMLADLKPKQATKKIGKVLSTRVYACIMGLNSGEKFTPIPVESTEEGE